MYESALIGNRNLEAFIADHSGDVRALNLPEQPTGRVWGFLDPDRGVHLLFTACKTETGRVVTPGLPLIFPSHSPHTAFRLEPVSLSDALLQTVNLRHSAFPSGFTVIAANAMQPDFQTCVGGADVVLAGLCGLLEYLAPIDEGGRDIRKVQGSDAAVHCFTGIVEKVVLFDWFGVLCFRLTVYFSGENGFPLSCEWVASEESLGGYRPRVADRVGGRGILYAALAPVGLYADEMELLTCCEEGRFAIPSAKPAVGSVSTFDSDDLPRFLFHDAFMAQMPALKESLALDNVAVPDFLRQITDGVGAELLSLEVREEAALLEVHRTAEGNVFFRFAIATPMTGQFAVLLAVADEKTQRLLRYTLTRNPNPLGPLPPRIRAFFGNEWACGITVEQLWGYLPHFRPEDAATLFEPVSGDYIQFKKMSDNAYRVEFQQAAPAWHFAAEGVDEEGMKRLCRMFCSGDETLYSLVRWQCDSIPPEEITSP